MSNIIDLDSTRGPSGTEREAGLRQLICMIDLLVDAVNMHEESVPEANDIIEILSMKYLELHTALGNEWKEGRE